MKQEESGRVLTNLIWGKQKTIEGAYDTKSHVLKFLCFPSSAGWLEVLFYFPDVETLNWPHGERIHGICN